MPNYDKHVRGVGELGSKATQLLDSINGYITELNQKVDNHNPLSAVEQQKLDVMKKLSNFLQNRVIKGMPFIQGAPSYPTVHELFDLYQDVKDKYPRFRDNYFFAGTEAKNFSDQFLALGDEVSKGSYKAWLKNPRPVEETQSKSENSDSYKLITKSSKNSLSDKPSDKEVVENHFEEMKKIQAHVDENRPLPKFKSESSKPIASSSRDKTSEKSEDGVAIEPTDSLSPSPSP